jgi:hypothetical protein
MQKALMFLMLLMSFSTSALEKNNNGLSCAEVIDVVKHSDCAELVKPLIEGASITVGLALRSLSVTIKDTSNENTLAQVRDTAVPAPFISFDLKPSYFGDSSFGWGVGFNYTDAYALEQRVTRSGKNEDIDLGTYITTTMLALSPNAFYQYGEPYSNHYFRIGLGLALGYASVRGTAFLTEDESTDVCYQAGNDLVDKSGPATRELRIEAIKNSCEQQNYNQGSLGAGGNFFMQGQYQNWQASLNFANLILSKNNRKLEPSMVSFQVAYVIPL